MYKYFLVCIKSCAPLIIFILGCFFDKKYLKGRHFDAGYSGIRWAVKAIWLRNVLRLAPPLPFPAALTATVSNPKRIHFHPDDLNNFQSPGIYFQSFKGDIFIGKGVYIAPNVGIITTNHKIGSLDDHEEGKDILIGEGSWIGMNSVVLPGVILGPRTVVAAGSVVTKSFPDGRVLLGGVPAKIIREIV